MKGIKQTVWVLLLSLACSGCASAKKPVDESVIPAVETISPVHTENSAGFDEANHTETEDSNKQNESEEDKAQEQEALHGDVLSIGDNSVVVSKVFTGETGPEGNYIDENTMVAYQDEEEQVRITVYFTDTTKYTLRKVWDNGAGGEDSPGSFADIQEGDFLDLRGSFQEKGYIAGKVTIYRNMDSKDHKKEREDTTLWIQ